MGLGKLVSPALDKRNLMQESGCPGDAQQAGGNRHVTLKKRGPATELEGNAFQEQMKDLAWERFYPREEGRGWTQVGAEGPHLRNRWEEQGPEKDGIPWKNRAVGESRRKKKVPVKPRLENFMREKNKEPSKPNAAESRTTPWKASIASSN